MLKKIVVLLILLVLVLSNFVYAYLYVNQTQTITQNIKHTSTSEAFIGYRDSTTTFNTPKTRTWTGNTSSWNTQTELPTANSPVRTIRAAYSPLQSRSFEKIVVTLSDDGYLDAYVWNGSAWLTTNNIGFVGTVANAYRPFDIAYEKTTGNALLVYGVSSPNPNRDFAYRIWNATTGWSTEQYVDDPDHTKQIQNYWIEMAPKPLAGSNEITLVMLGDDADSDGYVWSGSSWSSYYELDPNAVLSHECIAVAYEQQSGTAWIAVGSSSVPNSVSITSQTNGVWNTTITHTNIGAVPNWFTLKADPSSNKLMLTSVDNSSSLNVIYWSGAGSWIVNGGTPSFTKDSAVDTPTQRCADFAWEPTTGKGLIVWGTTAGKIQYQQFNGTGWQTATEVTMGSNTHIWVQLRGNPRNVTGEAKILGAVMESTVFNIGSVMWNGTAFSVIGTNVVSTGAGIGSYECFAFRFKNF
jgi:hypothetical protein